MGEGKRPQAEAISETQQWPVNVGMASRLSGLTPKMVRHYEAQGLLGEIERSGGGYRLYSQDDVQTLRFIQHCRSVEFSLDDIEKLLNMWRSGEDHCLSAKALAEKHIEKLECRVQEIQFMQQALQQLADQCSAGQAHCPILDSMSEKTAPPPVSERHGCCSQASGLRNV